MATLLPRRSPHRPGGPGRHPCRDRLQKEPPEPLHWAEEREAALGQGRGGPFAAAPGLTAAASGGSPRGGSSSPRARREAAGRGRSLWARDAVQEAWREQSAAGAGLRDRTQGSGGPAAFAVGAAHACVCGLKANRLSPGAGRVDGSDADSRSRGSLDRGSLVSYFGVTPASGPSVAGGGRCEPQARISEDV